MTRMTWLGAMLTGVLAAGTALAGWLAVPIIAIAWGAWTAHRRGSALMAGLAGMMSWGILLFLATTRGPIHVLATTLGTLMQVKPVALYGITLAFPGLLALTAAVVGRAFVSGRRSG